MPRWTSPFLKAKYIYLGIISMPLLIQFSHYALTAKWKVGNYQSKIIKITVFLGCETVMNGCFNNMFAGF